MTAIADKPAAFELHVNRGPRDRDPSLHHLSLRATGDGWLLLAPDGKLVFRAFGLAGRRQCLEFARELGALAVLG